MGGGDTERGGGGLWLTEARILTTVSGLGSPDITELAYRGKVAALLAIAWAGSG